MLIDRGEKPFQCKFCTVQFARKDLIKRHIRKSHPQEAESPQTALVSRRSSSARPDGDGDSNSGEQRPTANNNVTLTSASTHVSDDDNGHRSNNDDALVIVGNSAIAQTSCPLDSADMRNPEPSIPDSGELQTLLNDLPDNVDGTTLDTCGFENIVSAMGCDDYTLDFQNVEELQPALMDMDWNANFDSDFINPSPKFHTTPESSWRGSFNISDAKRFDLISEMRKVRIFEIHLHWVSEHN